jgi:hypothetical protein
MSVQWSGKPISVDHGFDLRGGVFPCPLNGSRHITARLGMGGCVEQAGKDKGGAKDQQNFFGFYHGFFHISCLLLKKGRTAKLCSALRSGSFFW